MINFDDFKDENIVSVWIGKFSTEEDFFEFIEFKFDSEGNASNLFCKEAGLSWFDEDFQDTAFMDQEKSLSATLKNISWITSFEKELTAMLARFPKNYYNSLFLLYDFRYKSESAKPDNNSRLKYIGSFNYE